MSSTLTNHYICPDDLSPLPTTLDAKKSPLALLAQTCSNIGADLLPNNKPIIPPLEKPKKGSMDRSESVSSQNKNNPLDNRSNSTSSIDVKISFKPYETTAATTTTATTRIATPTTLMSTGNNGLSNLVNKSRKSEKQYKDKETSRSNSVDVIIDNNKYSNINNINSISNNNNNNNNHHHHNNNNNNNNNNINYNHKKSSSPNVELKSASNNSRESPLTSSNGAIRTSPHKSLNVSSANNSSSSSSSSSSGHPNHELNSLIYSTSGIADISKSQLTTLAKSDSSSVKASIASSINSYNHHYNLNPSAVAAATNALQNDILKSSHYSSSLLSPYLNPSHHPHFNSLKANNVCRDPFCKGCQLSSLTGLGNNASCANGCNGCMHSMHPHPLSGSYLHPALSSSTPYQQNAANNALSSLRPFVCNWTVGGSYCGKTFPSCEELLQHLKTHTNGTSPFPSLGPYGFPPSALTHGLQAMPNLRSTQSHSSLDSLRYHPYKLGPSNLPPTIPPTLGSGPAAHLSSLTAAGLGSLYPSFGMYNGRL